MIVTDSPYQAVSLRHQLTTMGADAAAVVGEDDALVFLSRQGFDVVIIDLDLGVEVVESLVLRLRRDLPRSTVAILADWGDRRAVELQSLTLTLIYKPVNGRQLQAALGGGR
ncbi:MAG: hypothetical protein NTZ05_18395 [Chloroflexi bacterium]|nr:hypothetical protein [Chloroflexota bacterium]